VRRVPPAGAPVVCLAAVLLCGCTDRGPAVEAGRDLDLLGSSPYADVFSESVDLAFLLSRPLLEHEGWSIERTSAADAVLLSMQDPIAALRLPLASAAERELSLRFRRPPGPHERLRIAVSLNGAPLAVLRVQQDESAFHLTLPASRQKRGENELGFEAVGRRPLRNRRVALTFLEARPSDSRATASPPVRTSRGLWLPAGASLHYHLPRESEAELRLRAIRGESGVALVSASVSDGSRHVAVARLELRDDGRALAARETLPSVPGIVYRLDVANHGSAGAWIEELTLHGAAPPPRARTASLPGRPNLILFLVDALRADHLGAYGHPAPTSPRFDAFASEAMLFEDASAQSSWTRPSVASLLTGLSAASHGVGGLRNSLVPEITTLAETLQSSGYRTAAFVGNGVVSPALGFDQGFETWNQRRKLYGKPSSAIVAAALDWIGAQPQPFFAYVHTLDPHRPYRPEPRHWAPFLFEGYRGSRDIRSLLGKAKLEPDELRFLRSAYEGEIRQNDDAFGAFLDGLAQRGLLEKSVIAFTADHGEEFLDHGGDGHSGTLYREVLHIPLAFRLPGPAPAGRDKTPVQQTDVAPTLLALAGVAAPGDIEGRDLSARCLGAAPPEEAAVLTSWLSYGAADKTVSRIGSMKLIVNREKGRPPGTRLELYDLEHDPAEANNIAATRPLVVRYLLARAAEARVAATERRERLNAGREVPMTDEQREHLKALGYIH
jgi:choline-sulfatase